MSVVDISEYKSHIAGPVMCLRCGSMHISVRPAGVDEVECHVCHAVRAVPVVTALEGVRDYIMGGECCGDVDADGVCCAPACDAGVAARTIQFIINQYDDATARN